MKAFISVDLEGMPFIVTPGQLHVKGPMYEEARKIATKVTLTVADELHKNGFDQVIIADSHGPMVNLLIDDLPDYVELIRGYPRPASMVAGAEGCDAAALLGYHAKFGTRKSTFDHTYSGGSINKLEINGTTMSEFLLSSYAVGEQNLPVILVAGEAQLLEDDVKHYAPWAETVALKHSLGRVSARSASISKIQNELREATKKAAANLKAGKTRLLTAKPPVKVRVTFIFSHFADVAELLPNITRVDGLTVEYSSKGTVEAFKTFEALVLLSSAMAAILAESR